MMARLQLTRTTADAASPTKARARPRGRAPPRPRRLQGLGDAAAATTARLSSTRTTGGRQQVRRKRQRPSAAGPATARLDRAASKVFFPRRSRRRDDGAQPALQEPRGGRQVRQRQHVRAAGENVPDRAAQAHGRRRRDDGAAPALQEPRVDGGKSDESGARGRRERSTRLPQEPATSVARRWRVLQLYKNHWADGSTSDESAGTPAGRREQPRPRLPPRERRAPPRRRRGSSSTRTGARPYADARLRDYKRRGEGRARAEQVPGGRNARAPRHRAGQLRAVRELPVERQRCRRKLGDGDGLGCGPGLCPPSG